jgi:hypothetical protein
MGVGFLDRRRPCDRYDGLVVKLPEAPNGGCVGKGTSMGATLVSLSFCVVMQI